MSKEETKVTLEDVIGYAPETYFSEDEISWIKGTFRNNPKAINTIRKVFLPTAKDLPVEDLTSDMWFNGGADYSMMPAEHIKSLIVARQDVIKWVMNGLVKLKIFANTVDESPQEKTLRMKKDSAK